jgi:hypothetical protein
MRRFRKAQQKTPVSQPPNRPCLKHQIAQGTDPDDRVLL